MPEKLVLVVCDGLGDLPVNGKTPLKLAKKPFIDKLAKKGQCGLMHTLGRGVIPGSDTAHLAIFGYDPAVYYNGRGVFEALGAGLELKHGDVAFRCNFASVDNSFNITDRRAGRIDSSFAKELAKSLQGLVIQGKRVSFVSTVEHRGVLLLHGPGLSNKISSTDPHSLGRVQKSAAKAKSPDAEKTASILNEFTRKSFEILKAHPINALRVRKGLPPANILLSRGAGMFEPAPSLKQKYGILCACVAGGALYKGVAKYVGMDVLDVKGATGTVNTDLAAKARAVISALNKYDFVFLHVKGTDSASHDGNAKDKAAFISRVDKMVSQIRKSTPGVGVCITGDHTTSCVLKAHSWEPVPVLLNAKHVRVDEVKKFDEFSCAKGALGQINGLELMPILAGLMRVAPMQGS